VKITDNALVQL